MNMEKSHIDVLIMRNASSVLRLLRQRSNSVHKVIGVLQITISDKDLLEDNDFTPAFKPVFYTVEEEEEKKRNKRLHLINVHLSFLFYPLKLKSFSQSVKFTLL